MLCRKCKTDKSVTDYYVYDGRPMQPCKECVKFRSRANRAAKVEYYREYDRKRAFDPGRVAARQAYAEQHREDGQRRTKAWFERHPLKRQAHIISRNAIRDGRLVKRPCERCAATEDIHAHHEDYAKPLDVNWLCKRCHGIRHREINAERRRAG